MVRTNCLICGSEKLHTIMDLGMHPFADTFIPQHRFHEADKAYPLVCDLCNDCGQIQTRYETNPEDRYCEVDYSYTSSNSNFSRTHWQKYAQEVSEKVNLKKDELVVEAGSNDGFLTNQFKQRGQRVLGVDPSPYMAELAKKLNVDTIVGLFTSAVAQDINAKHGKAKLVVANNVFNHSDQPLDFAKGAASLLDHEGVFVFELPYWYEGLRTGKFDQIYHEHVSYFTARSSARLMERAGMSIKDIDVVDYHGGSLRVYAQRKEDLPQHSDKLDQLVQKETSEGVFDIKTYESFMQKIKRQRSGLIKKIHDIKDKGFPVIAVGAAAKGNTFLNFYNLDSTVLDYVTDASPHKQNKYTPLSRIPIRGDDIFAQYGKVYALILSWNISSQLKDILYKINPQIEFIAPDAL